MDDRRIFADRSCCGISSCGGRGGSDDDVRHFGFCDVVTQCFSQLSPRREVLYRWYNETQYRQCLKRSLFLILVPSTHNSSAAGFATPTCIRKFCLSTRRWP